MYLELKSRKYREGYASAAPTAGQWSINDVIINEAPALNGGPEKWVCVASGSPGTWVAVTQLKNPASVTTISAAGTAVLTDNIIEIGTGSFNVTLTAPTAATSGNKAIVVNPTAGPVTLVAGTGTAVVGNVTIGANTSANLLSAGTFWYRS